MVEDHEWPLHAMAPAAALVDGLDPLRDPSDDRRARAPRRADTPRHSVNLREAAAAG